MYKIYIHQNKLNLKIYVGVSQNCIKRWRDTKSNAFNPESKVYNQPLYNAIRRDSWNTFVHQVIEEFDNKEDALNAEKFWIEFFRSNRKIYGQDYGYNLHEGGNLPPACKVGPWKNKKMPLSIRQKISLSKIGNLNALGNKASDETRLKMSLSAKNKTKSEKTKKNMSDAKKREKHPNFGKTWTTINGKRIYSKK